MAKSEFLGNVRIAQRLFGHPQAQSGSAHLKASELQAMIYRAAIWLTPKSVAGFDPRDFSELGAVRQQQLEAAVSEFRTIARLVPPNKPASKEQFESAHSAFQSVLEILKPYLISTEERRSIEGVLNQLQTPSWVVNWDFELVSDSGGNPAIYVSYFVDDDLMPRKLLGQFSLQMAREIRSALFAAKYDLWPYVLIKTAVEHKTA